MRTTIGTLTATAALALGATSAAAQGPPITLTGGHADWGVKQSFRNYIQGPIAHGQIATSDGATTNADGTFRFVFESGTYDLGAHAVDAAFGGSVRFTGHDSGSGPLLDLTISDPRVETEGDAGTLYADVRSKDLESGQIEEFDDAAIATLDLTGSTVAPGAEEVTISPIAATLTEQGAEAFAGFYQAGTALDPLSLQLSYATEPGPDPDPDPQPTPQLTPQPTPQPQPPVTPAAPIAQITAIEGIRTVSGRRVALARLTCDTGACTIRAPKRLRVRIAGKRYRATVIAPTQLAAGERATIRLRLGKRARLALAGRTARVKLKVSVMSGDETVTSTIRASIRRSG